MSSYIDLDSSHRDRALYPNPAFYEISGKETSGWFMSNKFSQTRQENMMLRGRIVSMTLPWNLAIEQEPRLYVSIQNKFSPVQDQIMTINNVHHNTQFIMIPTHTHRDCNGQPLWINYNCVTDGLFIATRGVTLVVKITRRHEEIVTEYTEPTPITPTPDPFLQTLITLAV